MRIIIPVIFLLFGVGGGVGAGIFLSSGADPEPMASSEHDEAHGSEYESESENTHEDTNYAEDSPVAPGSGENLEYVRLNNQFVVPVVQDAAVRSLVVMSLTVEVDSGQAELVFNREPRLRDAFLRVMFSHANAGGFDGSFTSPTALNPLRSGLRDAAYDVLGEIAHDVLIVDIVRQDA